MNTTSSKTKNNWKASFFTIWIGQQFSLLGSMLAGFALTWWVTKQTGSATMLATLTMVMMLPEVFLGPFVGALIDRWNRRAVMIVADSVVALFSAWLALLFWKGALQMWHIYLIMLVRAIGGTFHWPAMAASTSLMVPREHLSRVAGLNQTMMGIRNIVSPPVGAFLMTLLPVHGLMAIDVITAVTAIVPLFLVRIPQPDRRPHAEGKPTHLLRDVHEGLAYVWHWPGLSALLLMATLINLLLNPAFSLLPILVQKHFGGEALQLGWMQSAWGIGVILGGLLLSVWGGFKRRIATSLTGVIGMGVGTLMIGMLPSTAFGMASGAMFFVGVTNVLANGPVNAIMQDVVDPNMQGRVFTLVGSMCSAMSPLGMALAGPVADALGVTTWFIIGGVACLLMGAIALMIPSVMNLEEGRRAQERLETMPVATSGSETG